MSVATISPRELARKPAGTYELIDVRTPIEFATSHVEGARSIPLDELDAGAVMAERGGPGDGPLYVMCGAGVRGARAAEKLAAAGHRNVLNVEGGLNAWIDSGLPVVQGGSDVMSLERQVRIGAGALVVAGVVFGAVIHWVFYLVAAFVGVGLIFAGVSNWCGMAMVLMRMPWNQRPAGGANCGSRAARSGT